MFLSSCQRLSGRVVKAADLKTSCYPLGNSFVGSNPAAVAHCFDRHVRTTSPQKSEELFNINAKESSQTSTENA